MLVAGLTMFRTADAQTDDERRLEALRAIPYVAWTEHDVDPSEAGVMVHDPSRAHSGYTLYGARDHAAMVDMDGREILSWRNPLLTLVDHVELTMDGGLIACATMKGLYKLDPTGEIVWSISADVHHDFDVEPDGGLLVLTQEEVAVPALFGPGPVLSDKVVRVGVDGSTTDVWRLLEHREELLEWCSEEAVSSIMEAGMKRDWSHTNTLEIIREPGPLSAEVGGPLFASAFTGAGPLETADGSEPPRAHPAFRSGNVILCVRNLDIVCVVDLSTGEIVWGWGPGELDKPHHPSLLANGNILVFDNGFYRGWSRVVEYDPASERIVWEYSTADPYDFFTRGRGACQKLPNGNVLITESSKGRVFEVTPDGDVVWEFLNPAVRIVNEAKRGTLYRSARLETGVVDAILSYLER